ncbi:Translin [Mycena galericulata]|nr:Translin [Mycena galericulata]
MDPLELENLNTLLELDLGVSEKIKEQVKEFDKKIRIIVGILGKIHSTPSVSMPELLDSVNPVILSCRDITASIAGVIPPDQFWRWKDMWSNSIRAAVFASALIEYLRNGSLLSLPRASEILGIQEEWKDRMVNELSRYAVNAVTLGNFEEPMRISIFVKDIFSGFTMLNLKNDSLRRRFDSLKYDLKKIEEVVYDVSLRKLVPAKPLQ